ncbi:MAG: hypothetical protein ABIJ37_08145 [Pseudomonadota bacterium]
MTNEEKNQVDSLELLRTAAYKSFNDRRSYEWKMCISIWTPFAVYIGALVTQPLESGKTLTLPIEDTLLAIVTAVVSALILAIQVFWTRGLARASKIDSEYDWDIRNEIYNLLKHPKPACIQAEVAKVMQAKAKLWHWSHGTQLLITLILGIVATVAAAAR